jgi:tol-pal system protein YbgF
MKRLSVLLLSAAFSTVAFGASAQEIVGLQEQIDSLKGEMMILQRKVYRDNMDAGIPAQSSSNSNAAVKLGEYDEIVRTMNGKIDELEYKIKQLEDKVDTMNKDIDVRFNLLEGKPITAGEGSIATPKKFDAAVAQGAPKSIVGDSVTTGDLKNLTPNKATAANMQSSTVSATVVSADELYKTGLEALKAGNSTLAEQNMSKILSDYPSDKLAGNAQYWLGEVYYSTKNYAKAAVAFRDGYKNYKNGAKGADSLLKLGLSMEQLGKKAEACAALTQLPIEFPKADSGMITKAKTEAKKLGCK